MTTEEKSIEIPDELDPYPVLIAAEVCVANGEFEQAEKGLQKALARVRKLKSASNGGMP